MIFDSGTTLKSIIESCVRDIATADAETQLSQRRAWMDLNKGFPLAEGLDHLEFLGVAEVKLTLWLEPVKPGWCFRVFALLSRKKPVISFRLCPDGAEREGRFSIAIIISREGSENVVVRTEPDMKEIEDAYVVDFAS